jgi:predicted enzyme related to lactoylglutathione lyase
MAERYREETANSGTGVDASLARHGGLSYLEIPALDARKSAAFYQNVVGWMVDVQDPDHPKFSDATGHLIGRWVTGRVISHEPGLLPYFFVDGIDEVLGLVTEYGGEIVKPKYAEGNLWVATVRDPAGNVIGLWQEAAR